MKVLYKKNNIIILNLENRIKNNIITVDNLKS